MITKHIDFIPDYISTWIIILMLSYDIVFTIRYTISMFAFPKGVMGRPFPVGLFQSPILTLLCRLAKNTHTISETSKLFTENKNAVDLEISS